MYIKFPALKKISKLKSTLSILLIVFATSLILPFSLFTPKVLAADSCPTEGGYVSEDTTWKSSDMIDGRFNCNETDVVVDGVTLILEVPKSTDFSTSFMQARSLKYKNGGSIVVTVQDDTVIEKLVEFITDPYNAGQLAVSAGAGIQLLSLSNLLSLKDVGLANLLGILGSIFFGLKPKHLPWGIVYSSKNRKPVSFAVISLLEAKTGQLVSTTVSDLEGRYSFNVNPGEYYMTANHDEFTFPSTSEASKLLKDQGLVYTGEHITIEAEKILDTSIPLDPKRTNSGFDLGLILAFLTRTKNLGREGNLYYILALVLVNLLLIIGKFNIINLILIVIYSPLLLAKLISKTRRPRAWGKVFDSKTNNPVNFAFVRLYDRKSLELINTKVTDNAGRFQFFVEKGEFALLVTASGYKFPSESISSEKLTFYNGLLTVKAVESAINAEIPVDPVKVQSSQTFGQPMS